MKRRSFFGHLAAAIAAPFVARAAVAAPRFSRFDIMQNFAEGFDPDRIARAFSADLGKAAEHAMPPTTDKPPGDDGSGSPVPMTASKAARLGDLSIYLKPMRYEWNA